MLWCDLHLLPLRSQFVKLNIRIGLQKMILGKVFSYISTHERQHGSAGMEVGAVLVPTGGDGQGGTSAGSGGHISSSAGADWQLGGLFRLLIEC